MMLCALRVLESMSRAMGSSCVFTCWGAASWHGGRVMLVFGARAAAGAGSCAGVRGGAPFGVVVVCGCTLVVVLAGGVAPVCGSGCGWWWVVSWREVCGPSRGAAVGWGAESAWRGCVPVLVGCGVPCPRVGEGGAVWYGGVVLCGGLPGGGGGHRVQVWCGGLSPVVCPLAVWGSPARSLDCPPGVFQYVGCALL